MAGASISASIEGLDGMQAALDRLAAAARRPEPLLRIVGVAMLRSTQQRFRSGLDPRGQPWTPLSPAYAAEKRGPPNILVGQGGMASGLMGSLSADAGGLIVGSSDVRWGTNKPYAAIHQFGGVIKPKNARALVFELGGHLVRVRSVTIPARPYLGLSAEDRATIIELADDWLERTLQG